MTTDEKIHNLITTLVEKAHLLVWRPNPRMIGSYTATYTDYHFFITDGVNTLRITNTLNDDDAIPPKDLNTPYNLSIRRVLSSTVQKLYNDQSSMINIKINAVIKELEKL